MLKPYRQIICIKLIDLEYQSNCISQIPDCIMYLSELWSQGSGAQFSTVLCRRRAWTGYMFPEHSKKKGVVNHLLSPLYLEQKPLRRITIHHTLCQLASTQLYQHFSITWVIRLVHHLCIEDCHRSEHNPQSTTLFP